MKIATLAIIVRENRVLLGYKKKGEIGAQTLNGPGGKCEPDETLEECVIRETNEEVGITLHEKDLNKTAVITFFAADKPDFEVHVYWTDTFDGVPIETIDMIPNWYDIDKVPYEKMLDSDRTWFAKAIDRETFRANVYYKHRAKEFERIEFLSY